MIGCHRYLQGIQLKALIAKIVSFLADEHMPYVKEEGNIRVKCHQLMNQCMVCSTGLPLSIHFISPWTSSSTSLVEYIVGVSGR